MPFVEEGKRNVLWRRRYSIRHWPSVLSSYKRGDPAPPNAVIVETSDTEGLLLLGRVGGTMPCSISTEDGKIKKFCYRTFNSRFESENGKILVLISDAILNFFQSISAGWRGSCSAVFEFECTCIIDKPELF